LYNKNKIIIDLQEQIRNLNFVLEAEKRKNISPDGASEKDTHVRESKGEPGVRPEQFAFIAQPCKPTEVTMEGVEQRTQARRAKRAKRTKLHD
jgi:hypothetical protein